MGEAAGGIGEGADRESVKDQGKGEDLDGGSKEVSSPHPMPAMSQTVPGKWNLKETFILVQTTLKLMRMRVFQKFMENVYQEKSRTVFKCFLFAPKCFTSVSTDLLRYPRLLGWLFIFLALRKARPK